LLTESQLRNRARIYLYLIGAGLFFILALQNARYGLYGLFYAGLLLLPLLISGAVYAWQKRSELDAYKGHVVILTAAQCIILWQFLSGQAEVIHWSYALALLSFLLLSQSLALLYNVVSLLILGLSSLIIQSFFESVNFFVSYALLIGMAGLYAWLYHHKSRFLREITIKDPLTGAYNLRHLEFTLRQEIARSAAVGHPLSLVVINIDYFAQISEMHGLNSINELLAETGQLLLKETRAGDSLYHGRGSIFYLLLPFTPEEGLLVIAERLRRAIEDYKWKLGDPITASVGCLTREPDESDELALLKRLENALQQAQTAGGNRVVFSKP
tara:strand:- start:52759 stop:53742 length:984 start_codon:yes stop_codon:yes gene_type:complete